MIIIFIFITKIATIMRKLLILLNRNIFYNWFISYDFAIIYYSVWFDIVLIHESYFTLCLIKHGKYLWCEQWFCNHGCGVKVDIATKHRWRVVRVRWAMCLAKVALKTAFSDDSFEWACNNRLRVPTRSNNWIKPTNARVIPFEKNLNGWKKFSQILIKSGINGNNERDIQILFMPQCFLCGKIGLNIRWNYVDIDYNTDKLVGLTGIRLGYVR